MHGFLRELMFKGLREGLEASPHRVRTHPTLNVRMLVFTQVHGRTNARKPFLSVPTATTLTIAAASNRSRLAPVPFQVPNPGSNPGHVPIRAIEERRTQACVTARAGSLNST
jgi:hypothetical protein